MVAGHRHRGSDGKDIDAQSEYDRDLREPDHIEPVSDDEPITCMVEGCKEPGEELIALMSESQGESKTERDDISPAIVCRMHYDKLLSMQYHKNTNAPHLAES